MRRAECDGLAAALFALGPNGRMARDCSVFSGKCRSGVKEAQFLILNGMILHIDKSVRNRK